MALVVIHWKEHPLFYKDVVSPTAHVVVVTSSPACRTHDSLYCLMEGGYMGFYEKNWGLINSWVSGAAAKAAEAALEAEREVLNQLLDQQAAWERLAEELTGVFDEWIEINFDELMAKIEEAIEEAAERAEGGPPAETPPLACAHVVEPRARSP